jgi:N utilization substance protein A
MNADFIRALGDIEREKGIPKEYMLEAMEAAMVAAYKRDYGADQEIRVHVDRKTGDISIFRLKTVVDEVMDPEPEISLEDALKINPGYAAGDVMQEEMHPKGFGRTAALTAKQVVVQRMREAERGRVVEQFTEKENEMLNATVRRVERDAVYVDLDGTEGIIPAAERMSTDHYFVNDRLKVYVLEVRRYARGSQPQVVVSRTHNNLVKRLFENEVPEIQNGTVVIRAISREAGARTKIAVSSRDAEVDPRGACIGQRGSRVENVSRELMGERMDIIQWSADPAEYIANALSPAKVLMVQIMEDEKTARVIVPDNQLSLAIGKEGQNARLAAKLTGFKIDIKSETQAQESGLFEELGIEYQVEGSSEIEYEEEAEAEEDQQ